MRSYNLRLFEDYFPFENNKIYYSLQSPHLFWPVLTQFEGRLACTKTETPRKKKISGNNKHLSRTRGGVSALSGAWFVRACRTICSLYYRLVRLGVQKRNFVTLKWVSHQQTYIFFSSFTQGCHCGKVLDDSFCVDSLASTRFSARGRGKKTKTLLKQLQLILLNPVQTGPPSRLFSESLVLVSAACCSAISVEKYQIDWMKSCSPMTAATRSSHSSAQKPCTNPRYTELLLGVWSLITNIQTSSLGCTYIQLMS